MESIFKGKRAVILSILVHVLILLWVFLFSGNLRVAKKTNENKITKQAIESYLYQKPVAKFVEEKTLSKKPSLLDKKQNEEVKTTLKTTAEITPIVTIEKITSTTNEIVVSTKNRDKEKKAQSVNKEIALKNSPVNAKVIKSAPTVPANFSSYSQLDNLRKTINKQVMAEELKQIQQFRSASAMHATQIPVPHSTLQLTPEQKRAQNTTRMSDSLSITKHDNGLCTLERKQFLSSPIKGSYATFSCGESEFDKSFREHMKKVQDRY